MMQKAVITNAIMDIHMEVMDAAAQQMIGFHMEAAGAKSQKPLTFRKRFSFDSCLFFSL